MFENLVFTIISNGPVCSGCRDFLYFYKKAGLTGRFLIASLQKADISLTPAVLTKSPHTCKGAALGSIILAVFTNKYSMWISFLFFFFLLSLITNKVVFFLSNLPVMFMVHLSSLTTSSIDLWVHLFEQHLGSLYILNSDLLKIYMSHPCPFHLSFFCPMAS